MERESAVDEYDAQLDAMIAVEESMKDEDNEKSSFIDENGYGARIFISGEMLEDDNIMCRLAKLDAEASSMTETDAIAATKALRIMDDEKEEVIFDTGCTAHILRFAEGPFDIRIAPTGSCVKGVRSTATITHIGKMLGIGRVFVTLDEANLISVLQLTNEGASLRIVIFRLCRRHGNKTELCYDNERAREEGTFQCRRYQQGEVIRHASYLNVWVIRATQP